jgi:hypothetical protein
MRVRHFWVLGLPLLCGGCAVGAAGIALNVLGGASMVSLAVSGKGLGDQAISVAAGEDCRIFEGLVRSDRGICQPYKSQIADDDAQPESGATASRTEGGRDAIEVAYLDPAPAAAKPVAPPAASEAHLLAEHCAVATTTPCPGLSDIGTRVAAVPAPRPAAARTVLASAAAHRPAGAKPTKVAARSQPAHDAARQEAHPVLAAASKTREAATSVSWSAGDSVSIGFGGGRSAEDFRKDLQTAIAHWQRGL